MIKMMAVYDENPLYGARLADYVNQKGNFPFTAMAFTSLEQLEHYSREHEIEILLVSEASRSKTAGVKAKAVRGNSLIKRMNRQLFISISPVTVLCGR